MPHFIVLDVWKAANRCSNRIRLPLIHLARTSVGRPPRTRRETAMLWRIRTGRPAIRTQSDFAPITRRSYDQARAGATRPRTVPEEVDMSGVNPHDLAESDLIRELAHLHRTRHDTVPGARQTRDPPGSRNPAAGGAARNSQRVGRRAPLRPPH
jgi:hypothetical protein